MILLVEDDGASFRAITLAPTTAGHEVMNAGDGTEALELLARHHFGACHHRSTDAELNGLNLINIIRLKRPDMPLIFMSGYLPQDLGKAIIEGMAAFFRSPSVQPL